MWRAIWHEPQQWWPSHQDFTTEDAANQFALETSTRIGDEVSVRHISEQSW
jgi:hypothetical protein